MIGGAALSVVHGIGKTTTDIDVIGPVDPVLEQAIIAARRATGLLVPVSPVGVYDGPRCLEERLVPVRALSLANLGSSRPSVTTSRS